MRQSAGRAPATLARRNDDSGFATFGAVYGIASIRTPSTSQGNAAPSMAPSPASQARTASVATT